MFRYYNNNLFNFLIFRIFYNFVEDKMKIPSRESESRRRKKKLGRRVYKKHSTKEIVENIFQNEIKYLYNK